MKRYWWALIPISIFCLCAGCWTAFNTWTNADPPGPFSARLYQITSGPASSKCLVLKQVVEGEDQTELYCSSNAPNATLPPPENLTPLSPEKVKAFGIGRRGAEFEIVPSGWNNGTYMVHIWRTGDGQLWAAHTLQVDIDNGGSTRWKCRLAEDGSMKDCVYQVHTVSFR